MEVADEGFDLAFMAGDEGVDVVGVEEFGALGLGQDEIGEREQPEPAVEGEPAQDEDRP